MMKHPKLASVYLDSINISLYSTTSYLYNYTKVIQKIIYVQSVNNKAYTEKEVSFMYLSHLDTDDLESSKTILQNQLHLTPDPILSTFVYQGL